MRRNTELQTPWTRSGLLHHPGYIKMVNGERTWPDVGEWRDNPVFKATVKMLGTERGRSAAYFRWEVVAGELLVGTFLPMFMTDVGHILMQGLARPGGLVTSEFFVVKRGQNYGITPVEPPEPEVPPRGHERPTLDIALPGWSPRGHDHS